jgi:hypothetical protein
LAHDPFTRCTTLQLTRSAITRLPSQSFTC